MLQGQSARAVEKGGVFKVIKPLQGHEPMPE